MVKTLPTEKQVKRTDTLSSLLDALFYEIKELSKKKQDEPLNKLKVAMTNKILAELKELLQNDESSEFLILLDVDNIPTNSDAVLIMSQYITALRLYRDAHFYSTGMLDDARWHTKENP
ncbi:P-loop NTPase family protein [Methanomassiliicoccus luminyensis]|uniref:hypothetical protein n=1 Tax=Methanomassiliicoccus luminyensis TaxID=1080712 RepID=UPI0011CCD58E|nr:hypothetical protein [Methanomassiliicoccus luminyensis]